jgi:hypothetical protein
MKLRYAGRCRLCGVELPVGTLALYDREAKKVRCVECGSADAPSTPSTASVSDADAALLSPREALGDVVTGVAGASARREYLRRKDNRETRIRDRHPVLGGVILALSEDPQSTRAWSAGAHGEEVLGRRLDNLVGQGAHVLHDRRIPQSRANIDHMVVSSAGVFVIDAKRYKDKKIALRVEGGLIRARTETLTVGSSNQTKLVSGVQGQVDRVKTALASAGVAGVPVTGILCFIEGDWPLFGGDFTTAGVMVLWPKKAIEVVRRAGPLGPAEAEEIFRALASHFSPA